MKIASAPTSKALKAAAVSVVKNGFPVPPANMTTRPFSKCLTAFLRMYGSATSCMRIAVCNRVWTPRFSSELQQMNRVLNHRQKKGDTAVSPWGPLCFLSELITNEPADFYVLPNARDHLATQLINRLIRVFDKGLFKQHHLFQPLVQLALGDLLNHMIWLARLPRLRRVDVPL